jgi:hypothetical protein
MMKRALDCGAHGVMVPMCETKVCYLERTLHKTGGTNIDAHRNKQKPS